MQELNLAISTRSLRQKMHLRSLLWAQSLEKKICDFHPHNDLKSLISEQIVGVVSSRMSSSGFVFTIKFGKHFIGKNQRLHIVFLLLFFYFVSIYIYFKEQQIAEYCLILWTPSLYEEFIKLPTKLFFKAAKW